jgi:hypothetical protein
VARHAPVVSTASLADLPKHIDLPNGFQPEGIVSWGPWLFAGSVANGAIWRGNAVTGKGRILVPGSTGSAAAGLHIDWLGRLWVAGASSHQIRVYNAVTGAHLRTYSFPTSGFINDLDIVGGKVYATDSNVQQLLVVPLRRFGGLPAATAATTKPLIGAIHYTAGFNANGIVKAFGWLLIDQSNTGFLFRVNPRTGNTVKVDTHGYSLLNGDGMERVGYTLYVVRNQNNLVAKLGLSWDLRDARLRKEITSADLSVPTTATATLGGLYVVNARFGVPPTPTTPYWITRLPR